MTDSVNHLEISTEVFFTKNFPLFMEHNKLTQEPLVICRCKSCNVVREYFATQYAHDKIHELYARAEQRAKSIVEGLLAKLAHAGVPFELIDMDACPIHGGACPQ